MKGCWLNWIVSRMRMTNSYTPAVMAMMKHPWDCYNTCLQKRWMYLICFMMKLVGLYSKIFVRWNKYLNSIVYSIPLTTCYPNKNNTRFTIGCILLNIGMTCVYDNWRPISLITIIDIAYWSHTHFDPSTRICALCVHQTNWSFSHTTKNLSWHHNNQHNEYKIFSLHVIVFFIKEIYFENKNNASLLSNFFIQ